MTTAVRAGCTVQAQVSTGLICGRRWIEAQRSCSVFGSSCTGLQSPGSGQAGILADFSLEASSSVRHQVCDLRLGLIGSSDLVRLSAATSAHARPFAACKDICSVDSVPTS
jgi:hypothetical protein